MFAEFSVQFNLILFVIIGIVIWFSGTELAHFADQLSEMTRLGKATIGVLLLAVVTSLPEIATTIAASSIGNAQIALNNLVGGIPLQTVMLALADCLASKAAISALPKDSKPLLISGVFLMIQIGFTAVLSLFQQHFSFEASKFSTFLLFAMYCVFLVYLSKSEKKETLVHKIQAPSPPKLLRTPKKLALGILALSILVCSGGYLIAELADTLAIQLNLQSRLVGATFVALVTSLPELSTTFGAIRIKAYAMAFSNIFGSNALMIGLIFIADLFFKKQSILLDLKRPTLLLLLSGLVVTGIYTLGLVLKRKKTFLRMGWDSNIIIIIYVFSLLLFINM